MRLIPHDLAILNMELCVNFTSLSDPHLVIYQRPAEMNPMA